jgi:hypothetical protein
MLHNSRRPSNRKCLSKLARLSVFFLTLTLFIVLWLAVSIDEISDNAFDSNHPMLSGTFQREIISREYQQLAFTNKQSLSSQTGRHNYSRREDIKNVVVSVDQDDTLFYGFNRRIMEEYFIKKGPQKLRKIIGAFLEPETTFVIPQTINQGAIDKDDDPGMPPKFITPLPLRTFTPNDLKHYEYPKFQTCHDLPAKLPVDRGLEFDKNGDPHRFQKQNGQNELENKYTGQITFHFILYIILL